MSKVFAFSTRVRQRAFRCCTVRLTSGNGCCGNEVGQSGRTRKPQFGSKDVGWSQAEQQIRPTSWRAHGTNQRGASSRGLGGWLFLEQSNSSPARQRIQCDRRTNPPYVHRG